MLHIMTRAFRNTPVPIMFAIFREAAEVSVRSRTSFDIGDGDPTRLQLWQNCVTAELATPSVIKGDGPAFGPLAETAASSPSCNFSAAGKSVREFMSEYPEPGDYQDSGPGWDDAGCPVTLESLTALHDLPPLPSLPSSGS